MQCVECVSRCYFQESCSWEQVQATTELPSAAAVRNCTLIVKGGYIIHEFYDGGSNAESTFESDSMGKATTAVLIGLLEYRGLVDLDTPIINYNVTRSQCSPPTSCATWNSTGVDYFPNVTLRHVLSQATGYGRVEPGSFFTCKRQLAGSYIAARVLCCVPAARTD